jgi:hypothetical protein
VEIAVARRHPDDLVAEGDRAAAHRAFALGDEGEVDRAFGELLHQELRVLQHQIDGGERIELDEASQHPGQDARRVILRQSQHHDAFHRTTVEGGECAGIGRHDVLGVAQKQLAMLGELDAGARAQQQRPTQQVLQAPDLQAHRRLGAPDLAGGLGEAARLANGDEALQKIDVHGR